MADADFDFFDDPVPSDEEKFPQFQKKSETHAHSEESGAAGDYRGRHTRSNSKGSSISDHKAVNRRRYNSDSSSSDGEGQSFRSRDYSRSNSGSEDTSRSTGNKNKLRIPSEKSNRQSRSESDYSSDYTRSNSPTDNENLSTSVKKREKTYSSDSFSETDTLSDIDSDVTDVSPLNSPHKSKQKANHVFTAAKPPKSPGCSASHHGHVSSSHYKANGSSSASLTNLLDSDTEKMNLNILMQAVVEMEKARGNTDYQKNERIAKSRRVLFVPDKVANQHRKNYSFSNDQSYSIDRENQRLMGKILKCTRDGTKAKRKMYTTKKHVPVRMTPSAVNRLKEQQRIERENLALLKRLQKTTACKDVKRDHLLHEYEKKTIAGQSVAAVHAYLSSPGEYDGLNLTLLEKKSEDSVPYINAEMATVELRSRKGWSRPSSASSYKSGQPATVTLKSKQVRPASAKMYSLKGENSSSEFLFERKKRPTSAHVQNSNTSNKLVRSYKLKPSKPDWDDRW